MHKGRKGGGKSKKIPKTEYVPSTLGDINFFEVNGRGPKLTLGLGELNPEV